MRDPLSGAQQAVQAGDKLPEIHIALTPTGIAAAAIATRDFQPVHHDLERAHSLGNANVFLNTHATAGYLERLVMEWAGEGAFLKSIKFRLGVPSYAGDTLVLRGEVIDAPDADGYVTVKAIGTNALGTHVEGSVTVRMPAA
jgi:acyl dehydratase